MTATIRDVAKRARVSPATVSRVLNGRPEVDPILAERVRRAAAALAYRPNRAARELRANRRHAFGLILSDIENPFFGTLTGAIEEVAYANGFSLILCNAGEDSERERLHADFLQAERVAGVIIATTDERRGRAAVAMLVAHGIPVVAVDRRIRGVTVDTVTVDNVGGARIAARHLLEDGHTRIGFISGPTAVSPGRDRRLGFEMSLREAGIRARRELVRTGDFRYGSGRRETDALLSLASPPTAIIASNNLMTMGALAAVHARGLRVPDDVAIVGFDDVPWAPELDPALTTVAQPTPDEGRSAAELLLRRIADPQAPYQTLVLDPSLIVRASCAHHVTAKGCVDSHVAALLLPQSAATAATFAAARCREGG